MNVAEFKSVSIFNFIMKKDLRFKSNGTHYNYLFIANLITKSNNLDLLENVVKYIFVFIINW